MSEIKIAKGYVPGSLGRVVELHGIYYHDQWKFGLFFETKVAVELSEFLKRYDEGREAPLQLMVFMPKARGHISGGS